MSSDSSHNNDPKPMSKGAPKEEEEDFFIPGRVVWIHRVEAHLEAAVVPPWCPSLRKIIIDERMVHDHRGLQYHNALLAVQAHQALSAPEKLVRWQRFAD